MKEKDLTLNITKKGFTLVELAIIIVVIGILLGLTLKAKSLIDGARIKKQLNAVPRITGAFGAYYAKYGSFPGAGSDGQIISTAELSKALVKEGLMKDDDFSASSPNSGAGWWAFTGCKDMSDHWKEQAPTAKSRICIVKVATPSKSNTSAGGDLVKSSTMDGATLCLLETMLDDKNVSKGDGRWPRADASLSGKVDTTNWNCDEKKNTGKNIQYLYKIW